MDYTTLITALRTTAARLRSGAPYEWGHVGRCNCGHLTQTLTELSDRQIYERFAPTLDEWSEHANDYCPVTGSRVEELFDELERHGFSREDMKNLENLSDPTVLHELPAERRHLRRNCREDVVTYMEALAGVMEKRRAA